MLVFTMEILKIEGATRPAERGPPPFTDFTADATAFDEASKPVVMAVLRQPVASAKLFAAFKSAARALVKKGDATEQAFGLTAASKFDGKAYTTDPLAARLKLSAPAIYVLDGHAGYSKCAIGRPTQTEVGEMAETIKGCATRALSFRAQEAQGKQEL